jgi:hypothetical protein
MTNYHMSILTKISNSNHLHTCIAGIYIYIYVGIYLHCRYIEGSSETGGSFNG